MPYVRCYASARSGSAHERSRRTRQLVIDIVQHEHAGQRQPELDARVLFAVARARDRLTTATVSHHTLRTRAAILIAMT